jgi:prephenate dehydrogenase
MPNGARPSGGSRADGTMTAIPSQAEGSPHLPERIAFIGFGQIAASVAAALRRSGRTHHLTGWTPAGRGPAEGLAAGLLDTVGESVDEAVDRAGLVVLAGPPLAILAGLADLGARIRETVPAGATITDVGSTKGAIVEAAAGYGLPFVGGHPMAGREGSGVAARDPDLFRGRPWVIVPAASAAAIDVARVEALAAAVGARPIRMTPKEHDEAVASISHAPLVVAAALVEAAAGTSDWSVARELAAGGWSGMTRLARGDVEMGVGILATNAAAVARRLRDLRRVIDGWIEDLESTDSGGVAAEGRGSPVRARLAAARAILEGEDEP